MRDLKVAITKEQLTELLPEAQGFLDRIDQLAALQLSQGKWNKLYAYIAEARKRTGENIYIYESPALQDYDVSCHRQYPHRYGFTSVAKMIKPDPKRT